MVFNRPIPQTFKDHLLHHRMITVQCITTTTEIIIPAFRCQHIINSVIKPFEWEKRSFFISFCCVIKYNIQNHLYAIGIQFTNQIFQFIAFPIELFICSITGIRCKKTHGIISPVIQKRPAVDFTPSHGLIKLKDRHQFYRSDSKFLQIRDFFFDSCKGSRMTDSRRGILRKTADMKFINDQILNGSDRIHVISPVKVIDHHPRPIFMILIRLFAPYALTGDRSCIRIQKRLRFIKNQTFFRYARTVHPISILKITDIQIKNNHGIHTSNPVVFRERQNCIRFLFSPVI